MVASTRVFPGRLPPAVLPGQHCINARQRDIMRPMETFHVQNPHVRALLSATQETGLFVLLGPSGGVQAEEAFNKPLLWKGNLAGIVLNLQTDIATVALMEGPDSDLLTLTGPNHAHHGRFDPMVHQWDIDRQPVEGLVLSRIVVSRGNLRELWASRLEFGVQRALENGFDPAEGCAMGYVRKLEQVRQVLGLPVAL